MVNTSYQLDAANVDLQNLYLTSDNLDLAAMSPSRYVLDEVRIDLSFVVKEAKPDLLEDHKLPEAHKKVSKTVIRPVDSKLLYAQLSEAAKEDALPVVRVKMQPLNEQLMFVENQLKTQPRYSHEWLIYQKRKVEIQNDLKPLHSAANVLSSKEPLTSEQIESLRKLGIPFPDWGERWDQFYRKYESLWSTYADAVKAFKKHTAIPQIDNFQLTDQDQQVLQQITEKGSGWNGVKSWVGNIVKDYEAALTALNALLQLVADIRGAGLKVRIDREAVAAPVEARQKIHLTFHGVTQETVRVRQEDKRKEVLI